MRNYILIIVLFFTAGYVNSYAQASVTPKGPGNLPGVVGSEFEVSIDANNVTNLFGMSFRLNYNTAYLDYVSSSPETWFGNDLVFLSTPDETNGNVSIGVSRKYPLDGVNGSGSIVKIKFRLTAVPQIQNYELMFLLDRLVSNDKSGNSLQFNIYLGSTIVVLAPAVPKLYNPGNGSADLSTSIQLYWAKVLYASSYRIQISTDINFYSSILIDTTLADTLWYTSSLLSGKTYYWRVLSKNIGGISIWSDVWSFSTSLPKVKPECPQNLSTVLNSEFDVSIDLTNVSNLFGISFKFLYNTNYLDYVSSSADAWMGNDLVYLATPDEANGNIAIGISRKYPLDGVNGSGSIAHIKFKLVSVPQQNITLKFLLNELKLVDKNGNPINLSIVDSSSSVLNGKIDISPWTQVINGLSTLNVVSMASYSNRIYSATSTGGVFMSSDGGDSWTYFNYNGSMSSLRINRLFNNNGSSPVLYACTDGGLFVSRLGSSNWANLTQSGLAANKQVTCFASSSQTDANLIIGTRGNGIYKSNISGTSWVSLSEGLTNLYINDIITFTNGSAEVIMAGTADGVFVSTDLGITWKKKVNGLTGNSLRITSFIYLENSVLISTQNGVFRSMDLGDTWTPIINSGYYSSFCSSGQQSPYPLYIIGSDVYYTFDLLNWNFVSIQGINSQCVSGVFNSQFVYLGTDGNGVYRKQKSLISSVENGNSINLTPSNYGLEQNYPNPFNPSTFINYFLPEPGIVRLSVFDVMGSEVATLVNEFRSAGTHRVRFNAGDLPSGVYIYRLETKGFSASKKLLLIK